MTPNVKSRVVILLVAAALVFGVWKITKTYSVWKARRSLDLARAYFKQGRLTEATLSVRASLQAKKNNPEAYRTMAEMMEAMNSAEAIPYRKAVAEQCPSDPQAALDLARCALRFNRPEIARQMLPRLQGKGNDTPGLLEIRAKIIEISGDQKGAVEAYGKLWRLSPGSDAGKNAMLYLARIRLSGGPRDETDAALAHLRELADDPEFGAGACRLMMRAALQKSDPATAFRISCDLLKRPSSTIDDRLQHLDLMQILHCPLESSALEWLECSVENNPSMTAKTAEWVADHKGPRAALSWLERLPPDRLLMKPVPIVMADCYSRLKDWGAIEKLLAGQNWGRLEAQRSAMLAGAYRNTGQGNLADSTWKTAIDKARTQPGFLASLARLAVSENRADDAMEALWNIQRSDPGYDAAQRQLFAYYRAKNDSARLLRLSERTLAEHPENLSLKLSVATLLLVRDWQLSRATSLAREVYLADKNPVLPAAVYAFCLYRENPSKKTAEQAAALLDARSAGDKSNDDCLVYYGLILTACGRYDEARACFQKMNRTLLFPETLEKVKAAEAKIAAGNTRRE